MCVCKRESEREQEANIFHFLSPLRRIFPSQAGQVIKLLHLKLARQQKAVLGKKFPKRVFAKNLEDFFVARFRSSCSLFSVDTFVGVEVAKIFRSLEKVGLVARRFCAKKKNWLSAPLPVPRRYPFDRNTPPHPSDVKISLSFCQQVSKRSKTEQIYWHRSIVNNNNRVFSSKSEK